MRNRADFRSVSTAGTRAGNLSSVDDAERARARRAARSRVVLIIAALAVATLLVLIVIGALTSEMNDEIGQQKDNHGYERMVDRSDSRWTPDTEAADTKPAKPRNIEPR